ncbi:uncharacterized protein LOC135121724 [Zophobas morio]|uniref:uncharacterized protein LOC135121724 n=1 Tax=Zophobas morio TaxID=2755281 RepID=UPI003082F789
MLKFLGRPPQKSSTLVIRYTENLKVPRRLCHFLKLRKKNSSLKAISSVGLSTRYEVARKLSFPLNKPAVGALKELANLTITFVSLALNLIEENTCPDQRANSTGKEISAASSILVYCFQPRTSGDWGNPHYFCLPLSRN